MAKSRLYLGVDVGGTKIQASLVEEWGSIVANERSPTPREGTGERALEAIEKAMEVVLRQAGVTARDLTAIGVAIPGVVDPDAGKVVVTPNMNLGGLELTSRLESYFKVPVALGNDCNLGALGEAWLGSARSARSVMAILVGTGIGAGFVRKGKLWRGAREAAGEIGHIVMQIGGPQCGCGNRGCLEALASRTAIERDLREAVAAGRKTVLTDLLSGDLSLIRSNPIRKALEAKDELVTEVMRRASEVLGYACLTVRHLLDPQVIVLGGGLVEACNTFMLPIIEQIVGNDRLAGARPGGEIRLSALSDDAVVLGCVALARRCAARSPFKKRFHVTPTYPEVTPSPGGLLSVGGKTYNRDVYILVDGQVKKRRIDRAEALDPNGEVLGPDELSRVCLGGPEILFLGTGRTGRLALTEDAQEYVRQRSIQVRSMTTTELPAAYNTAKQRKAALIRVVL